MNAVLVLGLAFLTFAYTAAAYVNRKNDFAEDDLLQDLENYIAERELADGNANNAVDDKRMVEILEDLDERSFDLLASTLDLSDLDGEPAQDSLMEREEKALDHSLLSADNPDLREVLGEEEDGRVDIEARSLRELMERYWKILGRKIYRLPKSVACGMCYGNMDFLLSRKVSRLFRGMIRQSACRTCKGR